VLSFEPIPTDVTSLTLVMPEVRTRGGSAYPLGELAVPLPNIS
jgi:hypothetical protein